MIVDCATYQNGRRVAAPEDLSDALEQARSCGDPGAFLWLGLFEPEPELLDHMLEADRSRVSVQQNDDMRRISAWAAILTVPTAIAGIYGMNFDDMPELHYHYSYYVVLGIMATACVVLYVLFKRAKWL